VSRESDFFVCFTELDKMNIYLKAWGMSITAVSIKSLSVASFLPPGSAVWPGCVLRCFERVVSRTLSWPAFSKSRTRTAAERGY